MVGMAEIQNLCARIVSSFHPQKVLLFGSYAHGAATPDSDVDLTAPKRRSLGLVAEEGRSYAEVETVR